MLNISLQLPRDRFLLDVDISLDGDSIWAIMGRSGCGKTSLLRAIAGLESGAKGKISFHGQVWLDTDTQMCVAPEQRRIGYIFQEARLFPNLDVMGNLQFARQRACRRDNTFSFSHVVEQLGIDHLLGRRIQALSGGEKQRVAIARTLLNTPDLLLMDEPLASLDWTSKTTILPILRNLQKEFGIPVIFVSHAREEVARLADNMLLIDHGRVKLQGECRRLFISMDSDLISDDGALSILEADVTDHDEDHGLTELSLGRQKLLVNWVNAEVGTRLRILLPAQEVSIATEDLDCLSIQNRLAVTVETMKELGNRNVLLSLSTEGQTVQAVVTCRAVDMLGISIGKPVFAYFKASCLNVV
ncbi:molybdenum ABC transporter ATP-binding protein [uncultured Endozoicomonas sp.]|uniref:molybdenum ABC transporter ATP-binding protein n=1 Tax=uncultured Endozoicomonas sp. TaxID=432652 RepID=UPI002606812D|nr:molybdenum ABC transporter ATP-binding protein [uncultured Endozoicomonas sp.]